MIRSFLYVPGDRSDRIAKALASDADAVLIDLEDAVAPIAKPSARANAVAALGTSSGPPVWIRINPADIGRDDVMAIALAVSPPAGIVLAKCEDRSWIEEVSARTPKSVSIAPLIESARALRGIHEICQAPRVEQCHLGEIDLLADLGVSAEAASEVLPAIRLQLVVASAAAAIAPPIGGVFVDVRDGDGLSVDCRHLVSLGFAGRPALHPSQIAPINNAFRPSADEVSRAERLVEMYDEALRRGIGAVVDDDGRMIDEAVVRRARRLVV